MSTILWQRPDGMGFDRATIVTDAGGYRLAGTALIIDRGDSYDIRYSVAVDADWNTRVVAAHVQGPDGERRLSLRVDEAGNWKMGNDIVEEGSGARDVDLAFTPATITLPVRRLGLAVGQHADVQVLRAAFPQRSIEMTTRRYERLSTETYRYSSTDSTVELTINSDGLVTDYPALWQAIAER